jgi:nicotinamide riboside kinase
MTKIINLFGGPGSGKSTIASQLFSELKWRGDFKVEIVSEFAKELTYENSNILDKDQLFISANQNRRLNRLLGQVDFVITDSPILLGAIYRKEGYLPKTFDGMIKELFESYNNINCFIKRFKPYVGYGRTQCEEEAVEIDVKIKNELLFNNYDFKEYDGDRLAVGKIIKDLL